MRVILGAVLLACAVGAGLAALRWDGRSFALFMVGMWVAGGWFVAMSVAAAAKRGDEGFHRDEGDE